MSKQWSGQTQPSKPADNWRFTPASLRPTLVVATLIVTSALIGFTGPAAEAASDGHVSIEKSTNGQDADQGPGPEVEPGEAVAWTWTVTVAGDTTLYDLAVSDSSGVVPNCDITGDDQPDGTSIHPGPLAPGQQFRCSATGPAGDPGTIGSMGSVRALDFEATTVFEATDPSHHTVVAPAAESAPSTTAPSTTQPPTTAPPTTAPTTAPPSTPPSTVGSPAVIEVPPPTAAVPAPTPASETDPTTSAGSGSESAEPAPTEPVIEDSSILRPPATPGLQIETLVNGQVSDELRAPAIAEGSAVTLTYVVTNVGNVPLTDIVVDGGSDLTVDCGEGQAIIAGSLAPGSDASCTARVRAPAPEAGLQTRTGSATAAPVDPTTGAPIGQVTASDDVMFEPVPLPSRLAFTGPNELALPVGLTMAFAGAALALISRRRLRDERV